MATNLADPDTMIRRLAPALVFAMFVTGTFAALAAAHAFGTPAAEPGRLRPKALAALARDPLADRGGPETHRWTLELVAPLHELVRRAWVTNLLLHQGISLPPDRRSPFDAGNITLARNGGIGLRGINRAHLDRNPAPGPAGPSPEVGGKK
jgi:hypothetical protein